jgi:hypothetical protein
MVVHRDQNMLAYSSIKYTVLFDDNFTIPTLFKRCHQKCCTVVRSSFNFSRHHGDNSC